MKTVPRSTLGLQPLLKRNEPHDVVLTRLNSPPRLLVLSTSCQFSPSEASPKQAKNYYGLWPSDTRVEIEGTFPNRDIGFMKVGQQANVRLDAYPSERFGFVQGEVFDISADSMEVINGQWGYIVRIMPLQEFLETKADHLPLRPGMTATIDVTTGERHILSYFFAPIVRTIQDAMGER